MAVEARLSGRGREGEAVEPWPSRRSCQAVAVEARLSSRGREWRGLRAVELEMRPPSYGREWRGIRAVAMSGEVLYPRMRRRCRRAKVIKPWL